jgi:hypothetical protein
MWSALRFRFLLAAVFASFALDLGAATLTVTRNDDPAPNGCLPDDCSLREAIEASNALPDADLIRVPPGNFGLPGGGLRIDGNVLLYGSADAVTNVEGDGIENVFTITGSASVTLAQITIKAHGAHAVESSGNADTILDAVRIPESDSQVWSGNDAPGTGSLDIRMSEIHAYVECGNFNSCRVSDSRILRLQVGVGDEGSTRAEIQRSSTDGDLAVASAGIVVQTNGDVLIEHTTIHNTEIGLLFAAAPPAEVRLHRLRYIANVQPVRVYVPTSVVIDESLFEDNDGPDDSDGGPGAFWLRHDATAAVSTSSFVGNSGTGAVGGAILVEESSSLTVDNSTFAGNTFSAEAAQGGALGAAIGFDAENGGAIVTLRHVTIVPPMFMPVGIEGITLGGIGASAALNLVVYNSILAGSCALPSNAIDVGHGNIESPGDSCDFGSGDNQSSVTSDELALGALGSSGGVTPYYMPGALSVALDAAQSSSCLPADQRGYARPFGAGCDVGAIEASDVLLANGFD